MLRNPISFIFKLGKVQSLPFQPLRSLNSGNENPVLPRTIARNTPTAPAKIFDSRHSNQMSS